MFGFMKKTFVALLKITVNSSNHTKGVSLSNQQCMIQLFLLTQILMNLSLKGQITIHLQLTSI